MCFSIHYLYIEGETRVNKYLHVCARVKKANFLMFFVFSFFFFSRIVFIPFATERIMDSVFFFLSEQIWTNVWPSLGKIWYNGYIRTSANAANCLSASSCLSAKQDLNGNGFVFDSLTCVLNNVLWKILLLQMFCLLIFLMVSLHQLD